MADNTQLNSGSGGDVLKTEDAGGYKIAVSKIYLGGHGVDGGPVTASNPLPVSFGNAPAVQAITAAALPLPSGAATEASMGGDGAAPPSIPGSGVRGWLRSIYDRLAGTLSVNVANFPASQAVSGTVTANQGGAPWASNISQVGGTSLALGQAAKAASLPVTLASDQPVLAVNASLQAGTALAGVMIAPHQTGAVYSGSTAVTPQFAAISAALSGDNTVVAAVAGKTIRVLKYTVLATAAVNLKFGDGAGSAPVTGAMPLAASGGVGGAYCPIGLFQTSPGNALVLNLSSAVAVAGHLTYILV